MENDPLEMKDLAKENPEIVEMMRERYEAWFKDVGSTRPNNYDPPRIYISTPYENPVVLTRQDWRHIKGRPWAADSNGYWKLYAQNDGAFDVRLRFPATKETWTAELEMGGQKFFQEIRANATQCVFESVSVQKGNLRLLATLSKGNDTKGPWQVDVIQK